MAATIATIAKPKKVAISQEQADAIIALCLETSKLAAAVMLALGGGADAPGKKKRARATEPGEPNETGGEDDAAPPKKPSGFTRPVPISEELARFLGKPNEDGGFEGVCVARTEVNKALSAYISQHGLQDKADGRHVRPDAALAQLIRYDEMSDQDRDGLTYFTLQKHVCRHFPNRKGAPAPPAPADEQEAQDDE